MNNFREMVFLVLILFGFCFGYFQYKSSKLDEYYFDRLKIIQSAVIYGSPGDSMKELKEYENQIELYMHLDGYNGVEVSNMIGKAFIAALEEGKSKD